MSMSLQQEQEEPQTPTLAEVRAYMKRIREARAVSAVSKMSSQAVSDLLKEVRQQTT